MIVIKIMGGFASQLKKFIMGYSLAKYKKTELGLDISDYAKGYFRPYQLCHLNLPKCKIFFDENYLEELQIIKIRDSNGMQEMLFGNSNYLIDRELDCYEDFVREHKEYIINIHSPLIDTIKLKEDSSFLQTFRMKIRGHLSTAVHIRRGDFVKLGWNDESIFYKAAIMKLREENPEMKFFFFSNDLQWSQDTFGMDEKFYYVSSLKGSYGDLEEFFCMSLCDYRILSQQSSYSIIANLMAYHNECQGYAIMQTQGESILPHFSEQYGNICYMGEREIDKYSKTFIRHGIGRFGCSKNYIENVSLDEIGMDIKGIDNHNIVELIWQRYEGYKVCGEKSLMYECLVKLEGILGSDKRLCEEWIEWYNLSYQGRRILIVSREYKNQWWIRGMFAIGLIAARIGAEVRYINLYDCMGKKKSRCQWVQTEDMDGNIYPVFSFEGTLKNAMDYMKCSKDILTDGVVRFGKNHKYTLIEKNPYIRENIKIKLLNKVAVGCFKLFQYQIVGKNIWNLNWEWNSSDEIISGMTISNSIEQQLLEVLQ